MTTSTALDFLELSTERNAIDYLEKAVFFIESAARNPIDWKWVIICVHGALYAFMICALKGTDPDNVCTRNKKLIDFGTALERCQEGGQRAAISGFEHPLSLSRKQKQAVDRIHREFRNEFEHFTPKLWFIELQGFPQIIKDGLDVVRMVRLEMGSYYAHYQPEEAQRIQALIDDGQSILQGYAAHS